MAYTLDQVKQSDFYKNATPETQQKIEANFNNRAPSNVDRVAGNAANLAQDVSNITRPDYDINAQPATQNITAGAADQGGNVQGHSWKDVVESNFFQNADEATRAKIKANFEAQGGSTPGAMATAANTVMVGAASATKSTLHQVGSAGLATLDLLDKIDTAIPFSDENDLVHELTQSGRESVQNSLKSLDAQYQQNVGRYVGSQPVYGTAEKYGPAVVEGAEAIATGGASILPSAIGHATEAYYNIDEAERQANPLTSLAKAGFEGGTYYALGKYLPGSNIAQSAERAISDVASPYVNQLLAKGIGKAAGTVAAAGEGAAVGYGTTAAVAAPEQLAQAYEGKQTYGQALSNINEQGKEGAVFGAVLSGGTHAITNVAAAIPKATPKDIKSTVSENVENINKAAEAGDFQQRNQHFANDNTYSAFSAADNLKAHGFEPVNQSARAGEGAANAMGVKEGQAKAKALDPNATAENVKATRESLKAQHDQSVSDNKALFEEIKTTPEGEVKSAESTKADKARKDFIDTFNQYQAELGKGNAAFKESELTRLATGLHEKYNALHDIAPEEAQYLHDNITSPITGEKGGIDFQKDAYQHIQQRDILNATERATKTVGKGGLRTFVKEAIGHGIKHSIAHALFGVEGNIALAVGGRAMGYGTEKLNAVRRAKQSQKINERVEANRPQAEVEAPIKTSGDYSTSEGRAQARQQRTVKAAVKEAQSKFADHPDIASQINETNYTNLDQFKEQRSAKITAERVEKRKAEREAAAKTEADRNKVEVREFEQANPHLKELFGQARRNIAESGKELTSANYEKAVNDLAYGKKPLASGEKAKNYIKAGSKDEFYEEVRKNKLTPDEVKTEQRALIDLYHKGLSSNETLKPDAQKNLHRSLAEVETRFFKGKSDTQAGLAKERGETLANRVDTREKITIRNKQTSDLHDSITDALKDAGLSERKTNKFIKEKTNEYRSRDSMTHSEFEEFKAQAIKEAKDLTSPTSKPKTKTTTSSEKTPKPEEGGGLSETQIKNKRESYTHELTDNLGTKDFDKRLDELEAFREEYDLTDTRTDAMFDHYVDTLTKIHELKQKGVNDPQALLSKEQAKRFTHQGINLGKNLRDSLGIKETDLLPEAQRKALEQDIISGKAAKRSNIRQRAKGTTGAKLKGGAYKRR